MKRGWLLLIFDTKRYGFKMKTCFIDLRGYARTFLKDLEAIRPSCIIGKKTFCSFKKKIKDKNNL